MKARVIPSLTKRGWIKDSVVEKVDFILAYFFETAPSQSWMFREESSSVQDLMSKYPNDPHGFMSAVRTELEKRLSYYFEEYYVDTEIRNPEQYDVNGQAEIKIKISVSDKGELKSIARDFQNIKGIFSMVVKEVNYGVDE